MVIGLLSVLVIVAACDESFVAFEDRDLVFSIYGYLDPSREAQWLRVTPVRTSVATTPGSIDAVVTIEEVDTGRTILMSDSVFAYQPLDPSGSFVYAHNFSTSEPILAGARYLVRATRSDGARSEALVSIPKETGWVTVRYGQGRRSRLRVHGVEHVAMVETVQSVPGDCNYPLPDWREWQLALESDSPDYHLFQLGWGSDKPSFIGNPPLCESPRGTMQVAVVSSGEPWPYDPRLDRKVLAHPNAANNVDKGVGFVGGVLVQTFPYHGEVCTLTQPADYCDVTYDEESVTLRGRVVDGCRRLPLVGSAVVVREDSGNRVRSTTTNGEGRFRIQGLDAGLGYTVSVSRQQFLDFHSMSTQFEPAEVRVIPDIEMDWEPEVDPCQFD